MSKKTNTWLFILGATVFNILITIISFLLLLFIYAKFILPVIPEESAQWGFVIIFIAAIALAFVLYRVIIKYLTKRFDVEKYFDPIFGRRKPPARKNRE
jgi:membrane protein implicated in regulation of membrane protease activity